MDGPFDPVHRHHVFFALPVDDERLFSSAQDAEGSVIGPLEGPTRGVMVDVDIPAGEEGRREIGGHIGRMMGGMDGL